MKMKALGSQDLDLRCLYIVVFLVYNFQLDLDRTFAHSAFACGSMVLCRYGVSFFAPAAGEK
jgi:hypothetical protein